MKRIISRISLFVAIPLVSLSLFLAVLNYFNNRELQNFRVAPGVTSLYIGDSHVRAGINENLLPNGLNLSQNSESFKYSLIKLQALLANNPGIRRVYLGCGFHSVSSYFDDYISGVFAKSVAPRYFFIMPLRTKIESVKDNYRSLPVFLKNIFAHGVKNLFSGRKSNSFLGTYENDYERTSATVSTMDKRITLQYFEDGRLRGFSRSNLDYLARIIELCRSRNIDLIILNTPLHQYYKCHIPQKFRNKYDSVIKQTGARYMDFGELQLGDSSFMPDGEHLSIPGAATTTLYLKDL